MGLMWKARPAVYDGYADPGARNLSRAGLTWALIAALSGLCAPRPAPYSVGFGLVGGAFELQRKPVALLPFRHSRSNQLHSFALYAPPVLPPCRPPSARSVSYWPVLVSARNSRRCPFQVGPFPADECPAGCARVVNGPVLRSSFGVSGLGVSENALKLTSKN